MHPKGQLGAPLPASQVVQDDGRDILLRQTVRKVIVVTCIDTGERTWVRRRTIASQAVATAGVDRAPRVGDRRTC
jgi:hypothetical protein